jgi:hypothetical protein
MVDSLAESNDTDRATVETRLEEMKVFKLYPSSMPTPVMTWTGQTIGGSDEGVR